MNHLKLEIIDRDSVTPTLIISSGGPEDDTELERVLKTELGIILSDRPEMVVEFTLVG